MIQDLPFCSGRLEKCWPKDRADESKYRDSGMFHRCWCMTTELPDLVILNVFELELNDRRVSNIYNIGTLTAGCSGSKPYGCRVFFFID